MHVERLVANIRRRIGLPADERRVPLARGTLPDIEQLRVDLSGLNAYVDDLAREAANVGMIPAKYPRHVDLVMRAISALLPWYTRPIRNFALASAGAAREFSNSVSAIHRVQADMLVRIAEIERRLQCAESVRDNR